MKSTLSHERVMKIIKNNKQNGKKSYEKIYDNINA